MSQKYWIEIDGQRIGPLDLIAIVRRVRLGKMSRETVVFHEGMPEPLPAHLVPELKAVFDDQDIIDSQPDIASANRFTFSQLFKDGFEFFKFNQSTAITTGAFMLAVALGGLLFSVIPSTLISVAFTGIWGYFCFTILQVTILKKSRMQLLTSNDLKHLVKACGIKLLLLSLIILTIPYFVPAVVSEIVGIYGWFWLLVPGSLIWAYLLFLPLIVTDLNMGIRDALSKNHRVMKKLGIDGYSVIYALLLSNLIVAPLLVPLLITLPITMIALSEAYDMSYN